jgi:hypothetical protein
MSKNYKLIYLDEKTLEEIECWRGEQRPIPNFSKTIRILIRMGLDIYYEEKMVKSVETTTDSFPEVPQ